MEVVFVVIVELLACTSMDGGDGLLKMLALLPEGRHCTDRKSVNHIRVRRVDMLSAGRRISQVLVAIHNLNIRRPRSPSHIKPWRMYTVGGIVRGM
jgi:hypothetical protein